MPESITLDETDLDARRPTVQPVDAPTEKQLAFARNLYREIRDLGARYYNSRVKLGDDNAHEAHLAWTETTLEALGASGVEAKAEGKRAFSGYIEALITVRDGLREDTRAVESTLRQSEPEAPEVPAGRYAIEDSEGSLRFYVVDRPEQGRWEGYVFVSVQASDDLHRVRDRAARETVLAAIAEDPRAAAIRYGHELGRCSVCGRTLTNEESRAAGIGPICQGRYGW